MVKNKISKLKIKYMALQTVTTSKRWSLTLNDWWKGLLVAVLTPIVTIIMTSLQAGSLVFNWVAIGTTALAALLAYVMKNLASPAKIVVSGASPEIVKAVKDGNIDVKVGSTTATVVENVPPNNP
jgi:hypothetical protein